jgi:glutamyl-Q tRNA(Asp) synthetase
LTRARDVLGGFDGLRFLEEGCGPGGERGWIGCEPGRSGDIILARKDVGVAYHLAVVIDDAHQGVTHVIRGEDLFDAAHLQRLLQALLGLPTPIYRHHRLLLGADGKRLAKRNGGETLADLRAAGATPDEVRARVGAL